MLRKQASKPKQTAPFEFDLEKTLKDDPARGTKILAEADSQIQRLKEHMRKGVEKAEYERLGTLLKGFTALHKVIQQLIRRGAK